jgi:hypothetical protein
VRPEEDDGALLFPNIEQLSYGSCNTGEPDTSKHSTLSHLKTLENPTPHELLYAGLPMLMAGGTVDCNSRT